MIYAGYRFEKGAVYSVPVAVSLNRYSNQSTICKQVYSVLSIPVKWKGKRSSQSPSEGITGSIHRERARPPRSVMVYIIQFPWEDPDIRSCVLSFFKWYESLVSDICKNSLMIHTHKGCIESNERILILRDQTVP